MAAEQTGTTGVTEAADRRTTSVIGLFEDPLDLREALDHLRKEADAAAVSLIVRDQLVDEDSAAERHGAVARSAEAADIGRSATWLTRLASVIVPERGGFLVSGPIGMALTGQSSTNGETGSVLATVLRGFGFSDDETAYIEQRIIAGAMLAGVTSDQDVACQAAHTLFAEGNAVYLASGVASQPTLDALAAMHAAVPDIMTGGDVVVTDTVGDLRGICEQDDVDDPAAALCGRDVIDRDGTETGVVEEVLVDPAADATTGALTVRYVVVSYGGLLGLGRKHAVVPVEQVTQDNGAVRLGVDRETLERAPTWDEHAPFSRREEHLVRAYFGTPPYWTSEE